MYDAVAAPEGKPGERSPLNTNILKLSNFCLLDFIDIKFKNFKFSLNFS